MAPSVSEILSLFSFSSTMRPEKWIRTASPDDVMKAWMDLILHGELGNLRPPFKAEQLSVFNNTFKEMAIPGEGCDQQAFISYLSRFFPASFMPLVTSGPTLYKLAVYHAAYPFLSTVHQPLSSSELLRSITMLTGRVYAMLGGPKTQWVVAKPNYEVLVWPGRSDRDVRRLIFQALALESSILESRKILGLLSEDELLDVQTVVSRAQPRPSDICAELPWSEFHEMATRLSTRQTPIKDLRVTQEVLKPLLQLLIAIQDAVFADQLKLNESKPGEDKHAIWLAKATALLERHSPVPEKGLTFEQFEQVYIAIGRRYGEEDGILLPDLYVNESIRSLKPDMLQILARIWEKFVDPVFSPLVKA